jgi:hypothetical protein
MLSRSNRMRRGEVTEAPLVWSKLPWSARQGGAALPSLAGLYSLAANTDTRDSRGIRNWYYALVRRLVQPVSPFTLIPFQIQSDLLTFLIAERCLSYDPIVVPYIFGLSEVRAGLGRSTSGDCLDRGSTYISELTYTLQVPRFRCSKSVVNITKR